MVKGCGPRRRNNGKPVQVRGTLRLKCLGRFMIWWRLLEKVAIIVKVDLLYYYVIKSIEQLTTMVWNICIWCKWLNKVKDITFLTAFQIFIVFKSYSIPGSQHHNIPAYTNKSPSKCYLLPSKHFIILSIVP